MLITETPDGPYPYAGVPWFSTRSAATASSPRSQMLWLDPTHRRAACFGYLAATQATEIDPAPDAEPGKILHETARGEMAALGEVPFGRYYGSVDATPLFVMLAGAYFERTGDSRRCQRALAERRGGAATGSTTTATPTATASSNTAASAETGLVNQGWKDSHDSVFHADGRLAEGPIALVRSAGLRLRRQARRRRSWPRALGTRDGAPSSSDARPRRCSERFEAGLLVRGPRHLRAGARRRQAALPGAHLERRARAFTGIAPPERARAPVADA